MLWDLNDNKILGMKETFAQAKEGVDAGALSILISHRLLSTRTDRKRFDYSSMVYITEPIRQTLRVYRKQ